MRNEAVSARQVCNELDKGVAFNSQIGLYETVRANEDFYIGKQWEGVKANGLPTPVFNFIKRVVMYLVASTASDHVKIAASPLSSTGALEQGTLERVCATVNHQFEAIFEQNKVAKGMREVMRNAAVDGDGCIYTWFDPTAETGQRAKGAIRMEIMENTRVLFGNPNRAEVEGQPYILLTRRVEVEDAKERAERFGGEGEKIRGDSDEQGDRFDCLAGDKVTLVTRLWKNKKTGTVWAAECTRDALVRTAWDTGLRRYPLVWLNWDRVQNCYHGQAAVTGLIPNQIFVNKAYAMSMISLMTTAYPKIVYDKTRVGSWNNGVGQAIGVNGGDVATVAKAIDPATISPQISQFIESAIHYTKEFMGATDAALGEVKPNNTSAILALQKASAVPTELVKQELFQCLEDLAVIWLDMMGAYYGKRLVDNGDGVEVFDFAILREIPLSLKLDVGGSAYWSEIAQMQTLDNLLMSGKIDIVDYLERVPNGYIANQQELIENIKARRGGMCDGRAGSYE